MNTYLQSRIYQLQPFSLKISGKWKGTVRSLDGSSGVALTLKAMAAPLYELDLEPELLSKAGSGLLKRGE